MELPGLGAEKDVAVELERGRLVVRGERRDENTREADGRTLREVRYGYDAGPVDHGGWDGHGRLWPGRTAGRLIA